MRKKQLFKYNTPNKILKQFTDIQLKDRFKELAQQAESLREEARSLIYKKEKEDNYKKMGLCFSEQKRIEAEMDERI